MTSPLSMSTAKSIYLPGMYALDRAHAWWRDPGFGVGILVATAAAVLAFFVNVPGFSGYYGTSAVPYLWTTMWYTKLVCAIIALSLSGFTFLITGALWLWGADFMGGSPIARKSVRHIMTILNVHAVHIFVALLLLFLNTGFNAQCNNTTVPCASPTFWDVSLVVPKADKAAFYVFHGLEFALNMWAVGAFVDAVPYHFFPEGDSARALRD